MPRVSINKKKYLIQDFPCFIKAEMKRKRMKQEELAKELKMSQQCLSNRLCGSVEFSYSEIITIFEALELDEEQVIRWFVV